MTATATATVTLEINCKSSWGDDCTMKQVREQTTTDAIEALNNIAQATGQRIKIIGKPDIRVITFEES